MNGRRTLAPSCLLLLWALLANGSIAPASAQAKPEGEMRWALYVTLAPAWFDAGDSVVGVLTPFWVLYALHDALVKPMPGNHLTPSLAESWTVSADQRVCEFKLREGLRFHNGDPFTAEDVKWSFHRTRGAKNLQEKVRDVTIVDPYRVRFQLHEPFPDFMTYYGTFATGAGWIVPKKYFEQVGADGFKTHPIGLGPHKFVSNTPGVELVMEAYEGYWRKVPSVKRLVYKSVPEATARLAMLKRGEVDLAYFLDAPQAQDVKRDPTFKLAFSGGIGTFYTEPAMKRPVTQYAKSGDVHIAYQITGSGPLDLVMVPGFASHLELDWDQPTFVHLTERLGSFSRLIRFDKRGTGMSDRVAVATLEERMDDVRAVMDATGSERAAIFGISEGGPMSLLFAATYPERAAALVVYAGFAKRLWSPDYPVGVPELDRQAYLDLIEGQWSGEADLSIAAPSLAHDEKFRERFSMYRRMSASPGAALTLARMNTEIDVRHVLPAIHVPTLVLHRASDRDVTVENGRYLAAHIPGARYVEFPDGDHWLRTGDTDAVLDEIEEFLTGVRHGPQLDRLLTTVLFTDIAGSTERAAEIGDQRWGELKAAHHGLVRRELERFRGREVDTAGDGFLAMFDGPARAVRCAVAIGHGVRQLGVHVRAGLHTGEVELGHEGITGLAVHIGARVMSLAVPGDVLVSSTVKDLVAGAGIEFEDRGLHALKGVPGEWRIFAVRK